MPKITLDYRTVKRHLKKNLSDEDLKYNIAMLGTDLDKFSKHEIDVEIFPNRPDMLGEFGFIRAMNSFTGAEPGLKNYKVKPSGKKVIVKKTVSKVRPYTVCAIVKNLKFDEEKIRQIIQLQEKLHVTFCRNRKRAAIGIYPSEKIKYPIEYFAEKPEKVKFVPLGFDREITGRQILSLHSTGRDYAHLLEGMELFPFFKDSNNNIMSMPPIINSEITGKVTESTKEVFIECSGFDLNILNQLLNIIVTELADMGGSIYSVEIEYPDKKITTPDLKPKKVKLSEEYVYKLLGTKINIKTSLARMGIDYRDGYAYYPAYRTDILHPIDLVEDAAIGHGYDNFKEELPNISTIAEENVLEKFKVKISEVLIGLGFIGVATLHVSNEDIHIKKMRLNEKLTGIENSKSSEYNALRKSLIPSLMEVLQKNASNPYPQKIFDIGIGFSGVSERTLLGVAIADSNFTEIKQVMEYLMRSFGISTRIERTNHNSFIEGRVGNVIAGKKALGILGEIHPEVLLNFSLEVPVSVLEIDLGEMLNVLPQS